MDQDSLKYDSLGNRRLPLWLIRQKDGLNTFQPEKIEMKQDKSLQVSFIATGIIILLIISILTAYVLKSFNRKGR
jgi:hypothetical protein